MKLILCWIAVMGWALGIIVNVLSVIDIDVQEKVPYIWLLHLGIFVVRIPAVFELRKRTGLMAFQGLGTGRSVNPAGVFDVICANAPSWMRVVVIAGIGYAFINFFLFVASSVQTGAITIRGFSGHWIAFYGLATAVLYPFRRADRSSSRED